MIITSYYYYYYTISSFKHWLLLFLWSLQSNPTSSPHGHLATPRPRPYGVAQSEKPCCWGSPVRACVRARGGVHRAILPGGCF